MSAKIVNFALMEKEYRYAKDNAKEPAIADVMSIVPVMVLGPIMWLITILIFILPGGGIETLLDMWGIIPLSIGLVGALTGIGFIARYLTKKYDLGFNKLMSPAKIKRLMKRGLYVNLAALLFVGLFFLSMFLISCGPMFVKILGFSTLVVMIGGPAVIISSMLKS